MVKKAALFFGLVGYFLTVFYYWGPRGIALNETLSRFVPFWMCILTGHGMPILPVVFLIAPLNAGIYEAIGGAVASVAMLVKSRQTHG